jgi:uncharacterized protein YjbJ (UPF0337 family)
MAAQRIHGDDTTVPVLAKGRTITGRLWTYVRDDQPFAGRAPPAAVFVRHSRLMSSGFFVEAVAYQQAAFDKLERRVFAVTSMHQIKGQAGPAARRSPPNQKRNRKVPAKGLRAALDPAARIRAENTTTPSTRWFTSSGHGRGRRRPRSATCSFFSNNCELKTASCWPLVHQSARRRETMAREHIRGAVNKAKGAVKDAVGRVTRRKKLQAEGKVDKAKGSAQRAAGDVKDATRNATR